jgi:hypothetical protein
MTKVSRDARWFIERIHKGFVPAAAPSPGRSRIPFMSISSIPASPPAPITYPSPSATQAPAAKTDTDARDPTASQSPPAPAPLPPGQGTRVDQLV